MHSLYRSFLPALMLVAALTLSGCESAEEKAERYYLSGMELLAAGDTDRALVEFRNVFKFNGFHKEARMAYAETQMARGEVGDAYSQYLRLIEQYPDTVEVRQILAEIAISRNDWEEAERHGRAAIALTPDAPAVQAIAAALDYRAAVVATDADARAKAAAAAQAVLTLAPDNKVARRIVVDQLASGPNPAAALPEIDKALALQPDAIEFHALKFQILAKANDIAGTGQQLQVMFAQFPDNQDVRKALIGWYLSQRDIDGAEAFLRKLAGADDAAPEGHLAVVQLLQAARGADPAKAELDRLVTATAGTPNADLYRAMRAVMDFESGAQNEAITALEDILATAEPSEQTRRIKGMLARLLDATGNRVGARARIEEILLEDPTNIDALKLRAAWLIAEDKPGAAIVDLRAALDQNPRDAGTLTLMAQAHERDGSPELAGERLALAVEVSGQAPDESLRYARFLLQQNRIAPAEAVLVDALGVTPADVGLLSQLAALRLTNSDWARVQEIIDSLRAVDTPQAQEAAQGIEAQLLVGQNRVDDSIAFLERQIADGLGDNDAVTLIVQTQIRNGKTAEARAYLDDALAKTPDDPTLRMLSSAVFGLMGQIDTAAGILQGLIAESPAAEQPVRMLYGLLLSDGRTAEATAVLDAALVAQPTSGMLRWMKAGQLETAGDIDGAIAIFEALYTEDSSNLVVANNLASMISTHRADPESLERAFAIARRLRGTTEPAFQDTYGWIESRRGNLEEALPYLESAATGLPNDPLVQFHLGMTYAGLKRTADARRVLTGALDLAGDSPLAQFQTARETLAALPAN